MTRLRLGLASAAAAGVIAAGGGLAAPGALAHRPLRASSRDAAAAARSARLWVTRGAYLESVQAGGTAAGAGLRAGDVVVRVDNRPVHSADALASAVDRPGGGPAVEIEYVRGQDRRTACVALE